MVAALPVPRAPWDMRAWGEGFRESLAAGRDASMPCWTVESVLRLVWCQLSLSC